MAGRRSMRAIAQSKRMKAYWAERKAKETNSIPVAATEQTNPIFNADHVRELLNITVPGRFKAITEDGIHFSLTNG